MKLVCLNSQNKLESPEVPKAFPGKGFYPKFRIASYYDTFLAKISLVTVPALGFPGWSLANLKGKILVCNSTEVEQNLQRP